MLRCLARYDDGRLKTDITLEDVERLRNESGVVTWTDFHAIRRDHEHDAEQVLVKAFGVHPMAADNALRQSQHPRVDDWQDYIMVVLHQPVIDEATLAIDFREVDLVVGKNYIATLHDGENSVIDRVFEQVSRNQKRMVRGVDNLLFQIVDSVICEYMPIIDRFDENMVKIENEIFENADSATLAGIFRQKRSLIDLRRMLSSQREVLNRLGRDDYAVIDEDDRPFFRDLYEQIVRLQDITESLRDLTIGALDTYLSVESQRTNQVMKTLTVFTVFFLPISFIVGFYGMNFFGPAWGGAGEIIPPKVAFWSCVALIILIPAVMYRWMKAKRWL